MFAGGDTLEDRLLDEGVTSWPAEADVHLYEAVDGTQLGHIAAGQSPDSTEGLATADFGELTPAVAGVVLGAPGLGRSFPTAIMAAASTPASASSESSCPAWCRGTPSGTSGASGCTST